MLLPLQGVGDTHEQSVERGVGLVAVYAQSGDWARVYLFDLPRLHDFDPVSQWSLEGGKGDQPA